ncbi:MAG: hypothetical protein ABIE68_04905 [bacterium]
MKKKTSIAIIIVSVMVISVGIVSASSDWNDIFKITSDQGFHANIINTNNIANGAVTSAKIATRTITASDMGKNSVTSSKISNKTITASDIADDAITSTQIDNGTIQKTDLANDSVGSNKIIADTIGFKDIVDSPGLDDDLNIEDGTLFIGDAAGSYAERVGIGTATPTSTIQVADYINFDNTSNMHLTALGYQAANSVQSSGIDNTFIGYQAGDATTTGDRNLALGSGALGANNTGSDNLAIGYNALVANTGTGQRNVAVGNYALDANTNGVWSTAVGYGALGNGTGLDSSTAVGYLALSAATGDNNTALGYQAGSNISSGTNNIMIGYQADVEVPTTSNQLNIGDAIIGDLSTGLIYLNERKGLVEEPTGKDLAITESGFVQTNAGASGTAVWNLPEASTAIGTFYIFAVVVDGETIEINPDDADQIQGMTSGVGKEITAGDIGDTITLLAVDGTNWVITSSYGDWTEKPV